MINKRERNLYAGLGPNMCCFAAEGFCSAVSRFIPPPKKKESEIPTTIIPTRVDSDIFQLVNYPTSSPSPFFLFFLRWLLPAVVLIRLWASLQTLRACFFHKSHIYQTKKWPDLSEQMIMKLDLVLQGHSCLDGLANFLLDKTHENEE